MHTIKKQFIRMVIVGLCTNGAGFLLFILVTSLGVSPILTISIFYPINIGLSFYYNKAWSFGHHGHLAVSAKKYLIVYCGCYILNVIILAFFNSYLGFSHLVVQFIALFPIALLLFVAQRYWVFRTQATSPVIERAL